MRYRTRDLTRIIPASVNAATGSTRIERIKGRSDDMIIFHGVNVFPSLIEKALCRVPGLTANYQIRVWEVEGFQQMSVACERSADSTPEMAEALLEKGKKSIHSALGIHVSADGRRARDPSEVRRKIKTYSEGITGINKSMILDENPK